ncbi:MAG: hypothetical protein ABSC54_09495 [Smithellaceae bacterium]|jgi:hypothetical protein
MLTEPEEKVIIEVLKAIEGQKRKLLSLIKKQTFKEFSEIYIEPAVRRDFQDRVKNLQP